LLLHVNFQPKQGDNTMKKKWIVSSMIATILLIGGITACKHGCHPGGLDEFDLAAVTNRIASRLDLTESQKMELEQISKEIAEKAKAMHADRTVHRQQLADLVREDAIDKAVIDEMIDQKMVAMRAAADFVLERLIAFHATLTSEQREKIAARIEEHADGFCRSGFRQ
jgi:uncharacterized membrane protein